jgi:hypothetical protein
MMKSCTRTSSGDPWGRHSRPLFYEVSNEFFLLGVYRNHRLIRRQGFAHAFVDMMELRVTVRALAAFQGLTVALKAELLGVE